MTEAKEYGSLSTTETSEFGCKYCETKFSRVFDLRRHIDHVHEKYKVCCPICYRILSRKDALKRHILKLHRDYVVFIPWK